jgi:hypothetical protein
MKNYFSEPFLLDNLLITQQKNFESENLNYKTIKKIENFIYII